LAAQLAVRRIDTSPMTAQRFDVVTLFEPMFSALLEHGITGRAAKRGLFTFKAWNPRDFTSDVHRTVDDRPYGGGPGMVMLAEPLLAAVAAIHQETPSSRLVLLSPQGRRFDQELLLELSDEPALTFICGRYEAIDQRAIDLLAPLEVSLGDFVVSGGELPAMMIMDSLIRRLPGATNSSLSVSEDSFEAGLLDCPHFSRPELLELEGQALAVPPVLLSGHHANIARWRRQQMLDQTLSRRPDLIERLFDALSEQDQADLIKIGYNRRLSSSK
jgi:tRNA (guanine37-N1)-methyltransferase